MGLTNQSPTCTILQTARLSGDRKSQKSWYLEELKKSAGYMYSKLKYEKLRGRKMTIELTQKKCQINC